MAEIRLAAVIPAAGFSSRMDVFKPLIRIGEKRIIEHAIVLFQSAGIGRIVTVLGHRADELIPVIESTGTDYAVNENYHQGMFSSIQRGAEELRDSCDAFFLLPVDIPLVRLHTVIEVIEAFSNSNGTRVCYPWANSRRGHPPLIDASLIDALLSYNGEDGMRGFLRAYNEVSLEVSVDDPFIRMDVDTPSDLSRLKAEFAQV